jgi:hypothetical protein
MVDIPKCGDAVLYYRERVNEEIRQPFKAIVSAVYQKTNVSFARAPAQEYGCRIDLTYSGGLAELVQYKADIPDDRQCWAWP